MRKLICLPVFFSIMMITISCEKEDEVDPTSLVHQRWIESYEDKTSEEIEIYRAGDYKDFPPSRYRQVFYFNDNSGCKYSILAPDDGHYMANGRWKFNDKTSMITIFNLDSEIIYELEIVDLTNNILKLKEKD